ncbi:MAG: hypothetical protein MJY89_03470 [Bacteroidales bacterium]|nr:hypothetical protein [Bacteroidales bacterium]
MKRTLIKLAVAGAMLLFGGMAANAQPGGMMMDPSEIAKMQADNMKNDVNLSDEQYTKVLEIFKEQGKAMAKMFEGGGFDMQAMQKQREDQNKKLQEVLSKEQFAKYQKAEEERMAQFAGGGFGGF